MPALPCTCSSPAAPATSAPFSCRSLLEQGHRVTVLDRLYFGDTLARARERFGEKLRDRPGATSASFDRSLLLTSVDAVVDLSGISNDPSCELEPELTRSVNVDGAKRLAVAAREQGVQRYVFSSSCSVYGHGEGLGLTETSTRHPVSLYARAKAEVEDFLLELGKSSRGEMDVTCLRLATVFGLSPRMRFDLAINVMTKNAYVQPAHHGRRRRPPVAPVRARARRGARVRARADERRRARSRARCSTSAPTRTTCRS